MRSTPYSVLRTLQGTNNELSSSTINALRDLGLNRQGPFPWGRRRRPPPTRLFPATPRTTKTKHKTRLAGWLAGWINCPSVLSPDDISAMAACAEKHRQDLSFRRRYQRYQRQEKTAPRPRNTLDVTCTRNKTKKRQRRDPPDICTPYTSRPDHKRTHGPIDLLPSYGRTMGVRMIHIWMDVDTDGLSDVPMYDTCIRADITKHAHESRIAAHTDLESQAFRYSFIGLR